MPAGVLLPFVDRAFYEPAGAEGRRSPLGVATMSDTAIGGAAIVAIDADALRHAADWLVAVVPAATAAAVGPLEPGGPFDDAEAAAVARAVPRRRDEFHTGRRLARRALAALCGPAGTIPVAADRQPVWPEGFVGSISHCDAVCVAQVARRDALAGIGVDVERAASLEPALARLVATHAEHGHVAARMPAGIDAGLLCFSAKESVYKAVFPILRTFLDFTDVRLEIDPVRGAFVALPTPPERPWIPPLHRLEGRYARFGDHLFTIAWIGQHGPQGPHCGISHAKERR